MVNAQTTSIQRVYIPSTSQTLYFNATTLSDVVGGTTTLTGTGMVKYVGGGDVSATTVIPGGVKSITNTNGTWFIECGTLSVTCFEIATIAKVPCSTFILNNTSPSTQAVEATQISNGVTGKSVQTSSTTVTHATLMSESEWTNYASIYGCAQSGTVLGFVSSFTQSGNTYIVQCSPGPGWCLRFALIPTGSQIKWGN